MTRLACLLVVMAVCPAGAKEPPGTKLPVVTFAPFLIPGKVAVVQGGLGVPGKRSDRWKGPFVPDHPLFIQVAFGNRVNDQNSSDYNVRVYRINEVGEAPYPTIRPIVEKLRQRLSSRGESDLDRLDVPVYPIPNAIQILRAKTQYFDAPWGSGIFFVAAFSSGVEEYPDSSSLEYLFEGLSNDGRYFVSAMFKITHPELDSSDYNPQLVSASGPTWSPEWRENQKKADAATAKAPALLSGQADDSFQPSLSELRQWGSTLTFRDPWQ